MADGDRGGWVPPNRDDDDQERERQGGLSSGDPLWSGSPRPADGDDPSASSRPRPSEPEQQQSGWQPPSGSGGSASPSPGWQPPRGGAQPADQWAPPQQGGQWGSAPQTGQWGPPPQQGAYYGPPASNGKATAALVCGIVGLIFCPIIFSIAALVLGYQARSEIDASQGRQSNRGVATAGIVTGWVGIAFGVVLILLFAFGIAAGLNGESESGDPVFSEPALSLLIGALPL